MFVGSRISIFAVVSHCATSDARELRPLPASYTPTWSTAEGSGPARSIAVMWHRVDGVAAALSRDDAIEATAGPKQLKIEKETTLMDVRWTRVQPRK